MTAIEGSVPEIVPTLASASHDIIPCLLVLEHLCDQQAVLGEFPRALAPGNEDILRAPSRLGKPFLELATFRLNTTAVCRVPV